MSQLIIGTNIAVFDYLTDLGGVWRIKWKCLPTARDVDSVGNNDIGTNSYLGLACMHGGSAIYKINCSDSSEILTREEVISVQQDSSNEERLVYGMDWLQLEANSSDEVCGIDGTENIKWRVATCSFYDNAVQIWDNLSN